MEAYRSRTLRSSPTLEVFVIFFKFGCVSLFRSTGSFTVTKSFLETDLLLGVVVHILYPRYLRGRGSQVYVSPRPA